MRGAAAWVGLNERQRLYLATIFEFDQAAEADMRAASARWQRTAPAGDWRQITYDIKAPRRLVGYSSVQQVLRERGQHDPGSGATLAALRARGLITVTPGHHPEGPDELLVLPRADPPLRRRGPGHARPVHALGPLP